MLRFTAVLTLGLFTTGAFHASSVAPIRPAPVAVAPIDKVDSKPKPVAPNFYKYLQERCVQVWITGTGVDPIMGHGTGWIVHGSDGTTFVWTAGHVVSHLRTGPNKFEGTVQVYSNHFNDGEDIGHTVIDAKVIRYAYDHADRTEDIAVLLVRKPKHLKAFTFLPDEKDYPVLGDKLVLVGATGTKFDGLFISEGTLGRRGVKRKGFQFDYCNMSSLRGCSGGPIVNKNGFVVGLITRGKGETHSLYIPSRRIRAWAKKMDIECALNPKLPITKNLNLLEDVAMPKTPPMRSFFSIP